jgi:hypothetical protein
MNMNMNKNLLGGFTGIIWKVYDNIEDHNIKIGANKKNIIVLLVFLSSTLFLYYDTAFLITLNQVIIANIMHLLIIPNPVNAVNTKVWKSIGILTLLMTIYRRKRLLYFFRNDKKRKNSRPLFRCVGFFLEQSIKCTPFIKLLLRSIILLRDRKTRMPLKIFGRYYILTDIIFKLNGYLK